MAGRFLQSNDSGGNLPDDPPGEASEPLLSAAETAQVNRRRERFNAVSTQPVALYSVTSFRKDALILRQVLLGILEGQYQNLANLILEPDEITCDLIYKTMCSDRARRDEFVQQAESLLGQPSNLTNSEESFLRFLARFREGPSQIEPKEPRTAARVSSQEDRPAPREERPTVRETAPPPGLRAERHDTEELRELTPSEVRRVRQNLRRQESSPYPGAHPRQQPERDRPIGHSAAWDGNRQTRSPSRYQRRETADRDDSGDEAPDQQRENRMTRLKAQDIMEFDPRKHKVALFIKRIDQMTAMYGRQSVLVVLPLCVKGDALEWYTGLNQGTIDQMSNSLAVWKDQLRRRFAIDAMDALDEAHRLRFRWDREEQMDLRQYVTRKVMLLEEAGIMDEDQQVRLIWRGLDANLMATVSLLAGGGNTLKGFTEELYQHEYPAKRLWKETHRTTVATPRARPGDVTGRYRPAPPGRELRNDTEGPRFINRDKAGETRPAVPPERRVTFPRPRERDCRHCGGPHMDYQCPTRIGDRAGRPVRAYLLEPEVPEDERLIEVEYIPAQTAQGRDVDDPELNDCLSEEDQGNDLDSHARVGVA